MYSSQFKGLYILHAGYTQHDVALFIAASFAAGLVAAASFCLAAITSWSNPAESFGTIPLLLFGLLFGAGLHPLYSLCIAHTNDFVEADQFVQASTGLQITQSIGAVSGPLIAGFAMQVAGYGMLFIYSYSN